MIYGTIMLLFIEYVSKSKSGEKLMKINQDCVGCGQCVAFCEQNAIRVKGRAYIMEACIDCGFCAAYCPMKAIEVSV